MRIKKLFLFFSIFANLSILGFFKYYNFFIDNVSILFQSFNIHVSLPLLQIVLPVGISFYTFQSMSYTIDIFRGQVKPSGNFFKFSAYVALFPQLVAGPIVRYKTLDRQLDKIDQAFSMDVFLYGMQLFLIGLFKKVLIADTFAGYLNPLFEQYSTIGSFGSWIIMVGYSIQLYYDFSGYSDMAVGIGSMLGLKLPFNFNSPYIATSPRDFWRRWHMTLSTWVRDYLYIPLGGNLTSKKRTMVNIFIVFFLGGLWHGAGWPFIVWGLYWVLLIILFQLFSNNWSMRFVWVQRGVTFILVVLGWVPFRSENIQMALDIWKKMLCINMEIVKLNRSLIILLILNLCLCVFINIFPNTTQYRVKKGNRTGIVFGVLFFAVIIVINSKTLEFLYYQF